MATVIGKKPEMAEVGEPSHPWAGTGHIVKAAEDRGENDSGCPFETSKPVPFNVYTGDPSKGTEKKYQVDQAAIELIRQKNLVPGGMRTRDTVNSFDAAVETVKATQVIPPATFAEKVSTAVKALEIPVAKEVPSDETIVIGYQSKPNRPELPTMGAALPHERPTPPPTPESTTTPQTRQPRISVRFRGRFGTLSAPYDEVFIDGIALVLVQRSQDGVYYEPPYDPEELMEISFPNQAKYLCHSGVHYKMPDGQSAHTVYLLDGATNEENQ